MNSSLVGPSSGVKAGVKRPDVCRLTLAVFKQMKRRNIIRPNVAYVVSGVHKYIVECIKVKYFCFVGLVRRLK